MLDSIQVSPEVPPPNLSWAWTTELEVEALQHLIANHATTFNQDDCPSVSSSASALLPSSTAHHRQRSPEEEAARRGLQRLWHGIQTVALRARCPSHSRHGCPRHSCPRQGCPRGLPSRRVLASPRPRIGASVAPAATISWVQTRAQLRVPTRLLHTSSSSRPRSALVSSQHASMQRATLRRTAVRRLSELRCLPSTRMGPCGDGLGRNGVF